MVAMRRIFCNLLMLVMLVGLAPLALAQDTGSVPAEVQHRRLWTDFNHYVRIYRPDLAHAAVTSLLEKVDDQELLDIVETSEYRDYDQTIVRAMKVETLREISEDLAQRIQRAKIERSREPDRIMADIRRLAKGPRANNLATERLRAAGQYAAPYLLEVLLDSKESKLHPYVLAAMVSIGRPMVYPLSVALPELEPVPMGQIAQALAEIGYPRPLPYLKMVLESPELDSSARQTVQNAYDRLSASLALPPEVTAAELFLTLGQNLYESSTRGDTVAGYDPSLKKGIVWEYKEEAGLIAIHVPGQIFADVLAMKAAMLALKLDNHMDPALSLWLASNLRRENRMQPGDQDLSYSSTLHSPAFYIRMAGPLRQHDVLARALADGDTALALDAIDALGDTAGTEALVNRNAAVQPLLDALSYPDRRVRFNAAYAMADARPTTEFPGSHRVVTVLAEAVRQTDVRNALIVTNDEASLNRMKATLEELNYNSFGGTSIEAVADQLNAGPGVDLVIVQLNGADIIDAIYRQTAMHYKLASTPMLALVSTGDQIELNRRFGEDRRFSSAVMSENSESLAAAVQRASTTYAGEPIARAEALNFATTALRFLREIALDRDNMLNAADAEASLIAALGDDRDQVVTMTGDVLALINSEAAQQALANAAYDTSLTPDVQISLLGSLADSANAWGNKLTPVQLEAALELVKNSRDELAEAAAQAHGALTLPTSNVVEMLTK